MKVIIVLFLSCLSLVGAETGIQMFTSVATNDDKITIVTTQAFTRGGQTNLVRTIARRDGKVVFCGHRFCHDGDMIACYNFVHGTTSFTTFPNKQFQVSVGFTPTRDIDYVAIMGQGVIDGFYQTNGLFYPVPDSVLEMKDYKK